MVDSLHAALKSAHGAAARAWLFERYGIDDSDVDDYQLGYCPNHWGQGPTVSIPVYDLENGARVLRTIRHRYLKPEAANGSRYVPHIKGLGSWPYGLDELPQHEEMMIVEGEFKAITLRRFGHALPWALGLPGCDSFMPSPARYADPAKAVRAWYERFNHVRRIYLAFDPGVDPTSRLIRDKQSRVTGRVPRDWVYVLARTAEVYVVTLQEKPDDLRLSRDGLDMFLGAMRMAAPIPPLRHANGARN